jgi:HK97 family phage portal protein
MTVLSLLERALKPEVHPRYDANLTSIPAWQNPLFGNWPGWDTTSFPWQYVTEREALDLPVVGGFLSILTGIVLQMPLHAYQGSRNIGDRCLGDPLIIRNPSPGPGRTFAQWIEEYLREMVLHGNYVAVLGPTDSTGWPAYMYPVPCYQWTIRVDTGEYDINGMTYRPEDVFHVKLKAMVGDLVGKGLMELYPRLIAASVAAEVWAAMYFEGGAVPPAQIEHPNPELTQAQADELKAKWRAAVKTREAVVTPQGTMIHALDSNAEDAQLTETRRMNDQQLAMALGIPGALLGLDAPSLTYRNIVDVYQQFITSTVMGYLIPLEQQLTLQCLPRTHQAYFGTAEVLRPDLAARMDIATAGLTAGLYTNDEARALVDLPPLGAENIHHNTEIEDDGTTSPGLRLSN